MSTRLHIVVSEELLARVDAAKGVGQPRADWIRRAVEQALSEAKEPTKREQADPGSVPREPVGSPRGARSAAPAEQPRMEFTGKPTRTVPFERASAYRQAVPGPSVEGIRSSSQAKRDVAPVPKRGEKK